MGRKSFRAKLCVSIRCHVLDHHDGPPKFSATTQDISTTGMQVLLPRELEPGTSLQIEAQLPLEKRRHPFVAIGKVLRTHPARSPEVSPKLFPTAIRFVSFSKGGMELLGPVVDAARSHVAE